MIIESQKDQKTNIVKYIVDKDYDDVQLEKVKGTKLTMRSCKLVIDHDADVYTKDGSLLLRFRKNVLSQEHLQLAYDNLIAFARNKTSTRGATSGTPVGKRYPGINIPIMSNIIGYFDIWSIKQKHMFKVLGCKPPCQVRITSFTMKHPEKWEKVVPLIQEIDKMYKKLTPKHYKKQLKLANDTVYHIKNTSFTTVTTNVNVQTACHVDSGDCKQGFGNLVVIENGRYKGGYTCFPQYGVGVDVRMGDFLAMDVHQVHGNTKIIPIDKDAVRLSLVCYLREDVVNKSKGYTEKDMKRNNEAMDNIYERYKKYHLTI